VRVRVRSRTPEVNMRKLAYSINSLCEAADVGRTKVYELVRCGELELIKIGASSKITAESVERYFAKLKGHR
jgi:excisionase family DNA binding protein